MPRTITPAREKEINELFDLYDKDNNNSVDIQELGTLLRALGLAPSNAQITDVMKKYDKDKSGSLNKAEFRQLYADDSLPEANDNVDAKQMFAAFDTDKSGSVSRAELTEALSGMGEPMTKAEIDAMFTAAGLGDKKQLNFNEFVRVVLAEPADHKDKNKQDNNGAMSKRAIWADLEKKLPADHKDKDQQKKRAELYKLWDPNGNGFLSLAEVDKGCRMDPLHLEAMTDDLAPILMRAFTAAKNITLDNGKRKNDDDYVQKSEFRMLLAYIKMYFELWVMFDEVDHSDDRRVDLNEFKRAQKTLESYGVKIADAEASFKEIDVNGGGIVLFEEFCTWAIKKNLDADGDASESDLEIQKNE